MEPVFRGSSRDIMAEILPLEHTLRGYSTLFKIGIPDDAVKLFAAFVKSQSITIVASVFRALSSLPRRNVQFVSRRGQFHLSSVALRASLFELSSLCCHFVRDFQLVSRRGQLQQSSRFGPRALSSLPCRDFKFVSRRGQVNLSFKRRSSSYRSAASLTATSSSPAIVVSSNNRVASASEYSPLPCRDVQFVIHGQSHQSSRFGLPNTIFSATSATSTSSVVAVSSIYRSSLFKKLVSLC